jgi:hypothetical protein
MMELDDESNPDAALDSILAQIEAENPSPLRSFQHKLQSDLNKQLPDAAQLAFPFPGITYLMHPEMATPEGFSLLELPFPIGHVLTDPELKTGTTILESTAMATMISHVKALREYENDLNAVHQQHHPNARKLGVLSAISAHLEETNQRTDVESELRARMLKVTMFDQTDAQEVNELFSQQHTAVELAILHEATRLKTSPYKTLFEHTPEPDSHDSFMGISDFLPYNFLMRADTTTIVRENVESYIRERFYANVENLSPAHRAQAEKSIATDAENIIKRIVENDVDNIPEYFYGSDDLLQLRVKNQLHSATLRERVKTIVEKIVAEEKSAEQQQQELVKMRNNYRVSLMEFRAKAGEIVLNTLRASDNIADVLKAPDFRTWFAKNCNADTMVALGATAPVLSHDTMPFNSYIQQLVDFSTTTLGTRANGLHLFLVSHASAADSQTYLPVRLLPAFNMAVLGATGVGKSKNSRDIEQSMPPGIVQNLSTFSAQAFTTSTNNDNVYIVQEEGKASILAPSKEDRDRGGSNELNIQKDRLTRFASVASRASTDKDTGVVKTITSISSAHNSNMMSSNLNAGYIDSPLGRRYILYLMATLMGSASIQPEQFEELDMLKDEFGKRDEIRRQQLTFAMYMVLRALIKAAVLPYPDHTYGNIIVVATLKELGLRTDSTELHHFIQFAENYQLLYAAHMICWGPLQAYYHKETPTVPRWSAESIVTLAPLFFTVSLPATVFALTTLEFVVSPMHIDSFLCDLVELLHLNNPAKRQYRKFEVADRNAPPKLDVNYVIIEGTTQDDILNLIASKNSIYKLRPNDMASFIAKISQTLVNGKSFIVPPNGFDTEGQPLSLVEDTHGDILSFKPIEFERSVGPARNGKPVRMVVSLHFLQTHFKKSILVPATWNDMHQRPVTFRESAFSRADATKLSFQPSESSPMARAIETVLSNKTLACFPDEPAGGLPDKCYEFVTGYSPTPAQLSVRVPQANGLVKDHEFRKGFDGVLLTQKLKRDLTRAPIFRENAHILTPTAAETLRLRKEQQQVDEFSEWQSQGRANVAFTSDRFDGDYVVQKSFLAKIGYVMPDCFMKLMGYSAEEIAETRDTTSTRRIPDAIPLGFGPITYAVQKKICNVMKIPVGTVSYPCDTIYEQLHRAMFVERYKRTPPNLRTAEDRKRVTDLETVADRTPVGKIFFGNADNADEDTKRDKARLGGFLSEALVDAMDIDG